jgi:hypothetical protein
MLQGQALEIVLKMARFFPHKSGQDKEAIEEVEFLLSSFEDTGNYTEEDYMD